MQLTRLGHAALLIGTANASLLIDPGNHSSMWRDLAGLDAVLVTHQHADHIDMDHVGSLFAANPGATVIVEPETSEMLVGRDAVKAVVGDTTTIGDLEIEIVGGQHAVIHDRIPRVGNVGFLIRETGGATVFHPGDSYATAPPGVDLLALPLNAPWANVSMTADFANALKAPRMIPIHDANVNERGRPTYMRLCISALDDGIVMDDPALGETYDL